MSFHPTMPYGTDNWHRSMRATLPEGPEFTYTPERRQQFEEFASHYAPEHRMSAVLHALYLAQEQQGYISNNVVRHVAMVIGCTTAEVEDVVSYYVMFHRAPVGKYVLQVCTTLSCALAGSERVMEELQHKLGIKVGQTDPTGMFTIQQMECLGACDRAPVMMVNNDHWHEAAQAGAGERPRRSDQDRRPQGAQSVPPLRAAHHRGQEDDDAREGEGDAGLRAGADAVRVHARRRRARSLRQESGRLPGPEEGAVDDARGGDRGRQEVRPARPRRRRIPDRPQVAVRRQEVAEAEVHRLQRRRERAGHLQRSPVDGAQPSLAGRGLPDRLLRDRIEGRLHLHSRRVLSLLPDDAEGDRRRARGRVSRQEHHGVGLRLRGLSPSRRRRLRGGRRDGAARVARGQARAAALQAAVPRGGRRLEVPDRGE